ncbi:MAG: hypothetical protein FWJ62_07680 [Thermaerobacter sp.]
MSASRGVSTPEGRGSGAPGRPAPLRTLVVLLIAAHALFWSAWWLGFSLLPEGVLRGSSAASLLPLERLGAVPRALAVLAWNAAVAALLVAGANLVRVGRLPLGVLPPLYYWTLYGLLLGTNSFATPLPERVAPSLAVLLGRAGVLELHAYLLVAAALLLAAGAVREVVMWCSAAGGC